ncbi:DNA primase [Lederbergia wuyishanensis]|uniref:DNA primase n=1 Tax=Lederbergia wuyishanensis TaxID=1347903 RepID=A0ABU0D1F6_9BACI|nr:DNA primase [Lederbergia wuyishanensis]MCJ8006858.1 DNA primase [Lederbergia wuyishanensis]MDQ0342242.1 DNA primase [Lederbergia wuyishanensis]
MAIRIPEEKINEIKQSVDIVDVVSDYVQLKKQGRNYFGLCPFHGENTPSFSVSTEKQIFHCFGCGAGGNVFTFLSEVEGISFQEAAERIAKRGNIELDIEITKDHIHQQLPKEHSLMIEAHELLAKFYHHLLMNTNEGSGALDYLLKRGFTKESIQKFKVGYSLPDWDFAVKFLENRGYSHDLMEKAGLLSVREKDGSYFDRFRDRIMFPLHDSKGRIVAFSARALTEENQPKYLNTPETILFNKSSLLYNYHEARSHIRRQGNVVLFEGFADVISADSADVKNGVAVMGTALTDKHIHLLNRLTNAVTLCFDSDSAGAEAAFRSGQMLIKYGIDTNVVILPDKLDPDDYIRKYGPDKFREHVIGNAQTWMAYKLHYFRKGKNLQNEGEKLSYIERALIEISKLENAVERDLYLRQLSEEFSLSLEALVEQLSQMNISSENTQQRNHIQSHINQKNIPQPKKAHTPLKAHLVAERQLIARMLRDEDLAYRIIEMLGEATFHIDEHQAILTYLFGYYEEGNSPDPSLFLNYLPDKKLRAIVSEIEMLAINHEYSEKELNDYVSHVLKHPKLLMIKEKQAEQKAAERKNDFAKAVEIAKEIIELRRSL